MPEGHHPMCSGLQTAGECGCWQRACDALAESLAPTRAERDRYREALEAVRAEFDPDRYPAELADPVVQIVEAALRPQTDKEDSRG
jgi:hypothetical protein